ncbi:MAG: hypothetical protein A2842_02385 [Candidatus Wildermuthbacteria bacterium RIFCSPHIGHO2_01_FULL_48_25]|uniref:Type II secretion system protein GspH n=1 Tax=Candidatus Wildermuthbacteria bacterium RIFCSPLOWO2_01_FULL_48_16 TaxID=1802461 RepID=A0A1G2RLQ6_9BACT|nr:MAG: hypothetical protein A2842_02385 [Candidatus Wildermuthbacteria bacterium RIFCSPHIGHO2_01_FULL_48_25]OHA69323.1 MAG: hypothetical protein A3J57_00325 [Candidatus Wildermuthbacteria bacterium RIFCSPHIGHO2_02_FULL_49_12b]OHA73212.1 MAG: hypothetical protein A3B24_01110 [Candidatus Wildermuthbacteria bacterium RIFCSPLOWO2_01_FULL_48_16]
MKKGFTVVEILVYVAVLAVVTGAVFSFLLWTSQSQVVVSSQRRLSIVASQALELLSKEAREARSVYDSTSLYASSPGQLSLETTKDLPEGETETFVDFFLCGSELCMKKEGASPLALTPSEVSIDSLVFTKVVSGNVPSLKVDISLSFKDAQLDISQTVSLRTYVAP